MNQKYLLAMTQGQEKDIIVCLKADAVNIASFLVENQLASFIRIETLEDYPFLTARYGFVDKCYDQEFLRDQLLPVLIPMQLGETEPQKLSVKTSEEELPEDAAPRPDWNCLKDYGITDEEYVRLGEQENNEDEGLEMNTEQEESKESNCNQYVDYLNKNILPRIDYHRLQESYATGDKAYAKAILNLLHQAMVKIYGTEVMEPDYNNPSEDGSVIIPGILQSRKTGRVCLALLEIDLLSSGEHCATDFLTKYGIVSQHNEELPKEIKEFVRSSYLPYSYCYTAKIPDDIHIGLNKTPETLKEILQRFRDYTAELLPPNEIRLDEEEQEDMER